MQVNWHPIFNFIQNHQKERFVEIWAVKSKFNQISLINIFKIGFRCSCAVTCKMVQNSVFQHKVKKDPSTVTEGEWPQK